MYVVCALHVLLIPIVYFSAFCIPSPCTDAEGEMKCKLYCFQPSALVSSTCKQQLPERGCAKESSSSPLLVLFCLEELRNLVAFATLVTNGIG